MNSNKDRCSGQSLKRVPNGHYFYVRLIRSNISPYIFSMLKGEVLNGS